MSRLQGSSSPHLTCASEPAFAAAASTPGCLATPLAEEAERFAARSGERFPFLDPSRIKDAAGKRPGDPGYNPRTLYIPPSWYKDHKVGHPHSADACQPAAQSLCN